jgi:hypothetical protein
VAAADAAAAVINFNTKFEMKETIMADLKAAMKSGDKFRLETIRSINTAVTNYEKANPGQEIDKSKILRALESQRKMSIEAFVLAADNERAEAERRELAVIREYIDKFLPKQMTEDEIRKELECIVVAVGGKSGNPNAVIGKAMGEFSKKFKGLADMSLVSKMLKEVLA